MKIALGAIWRRSCVTAHPAETWKLRRISSGSATNKGVTSWTRWSCPGSRAGFAVREPFRFSYRRCGTFGSIGINFKRWPSEYRTVDRKCLFRCVPMKAESNVADIFENRNFLMTGQGPCGFLQDDGRRGSDAQGHGEGPKLSKALVPGAPRGEGCPDSRLSYGPASPRPSGSCTSPSGGTRTLPLGMPLGPCCLPRL